MLSVAEEQQCSGVLLDRNTAPCRLEGCWRGSERGVVVSVVSSLQNAARQDEVVWTCPCRPRIVSPDRASLPDEQPLDTAFDRDTLRGHFVAELMTIPLADFRGGHARESVSPVPTCPPGRRRHKQSI